MTRNDKQPSQSIGIRLSIWSIRNQSWLAGHVRIYIYAGTVLIAFLALAGAISIQTAMLSAICGGLIVMGMMWALIQHRKAILLNIQEPEVRKRAHNAMLAYLNEVNPDAVAPAGIQRIRGNRGKECPECSPS